MKKFLIGLGIFFLVLVVAFAAFMAFGMLKANKLSPSVEAFVQDFYDHYNNRDFTTIYTALSHDKLRQFAAQDKFLTFMNGTFQKLGKVTGRQKGAWRINFATDGLYFTVQYKTTHEKAEATDDFVLIQNKDSWLLVGYHINSDALIA